MFLDEKLRVIFLHGFVKLSYSSSNNCAPWWHKFRATFATGSLWAGVDPFGQWTGVYCRGVAEVAGKSGDEDFVHRAGESVGERVRRELQRQAERWGFERRDFFLAEGGTDSDGAMASGIQHGAAALGAGLPAAGTASHLAAAAGAWKCGKQNPFSTFPHPRRRLRILVKQRVTLNIPLGTKDRSGQGHRRSAVSS